MQNVYKIAKDLSKSKNQYYAILDLLKYGRTDFSSYCQSQSYYTSYTISFKNMLERMRSEGYNITLHLGKLGGMWTAYATLEEEGL